jgi:alkyldihydroxyacetonephosphate synthase
VNRTPPPVTLDPEAGLPDERLAGTRVDPPPAVLERLAAAGVPLDRSPAGRVGAARDWWPLSVGWAVRGSVPALPAAVARPTAAEQVATVLRACQEAGVPVTPSAGRSGVCGGAVPAFGGLALDLTALAGVHELDETSLVAEVGAGTFGPDLETALRGTGPGYTLGHWPQSMDLSTVGGWVACRSAGQYSTRYGKIEDLVAGLEVVLADGTMLCTEAAAPRAAAGPGLTQLFVGSEGTLGVITAVRLRLSPVPAASERRAVRFTTFEDGIDACRRILRRGGRPAVLRLYDPAETARNFDTDGSLLVVLDEADPAVLAATMAICDDECAAGEPADPGYVDRWLADRNDTSALGPLWQGGIVVDTVEVAGRWAVLPVLAAEAIEAVRALEGTIVASVHQSHAYPDGACLYFTFAGRGPDDADPEWADRYYRAAWDAATGVVLAHGAAVSHHHGIGLNRGRFLAASLGPAHGVLAAVKRALDPAGILNPGKLGLESPFGSPPWP